jgi:general secretion pathway protein I
MSATPAHCKFAEVRTKAVAKRAAGFTLVEVLVALGIVAVALTAGLKATASLAYNAQRQSDALLAQLCAENELVRVRLSPQMPLVGDTPSTCTQAGQTLQLISSVRPTPNPNFLRVEAQVLRDQTPLLQITTVVGRY